MQRLPGLLASVLLVFLLTSCSVVAQGRNYLNKPAGIALVYDSGWTVVQRAELKTALDSIDRKDVPTEGASEVVPHIDFSIAKSSKVGEVTHTANLMIMVVAFSKEVCDHLNSKQFFDEESSEYIASWPGGRLAPEMDIPVPGARTYTASIPLADRVVTQHRYLYCLDGNYVVVQTTSSTPAGEEAVAEVLRSIRVSKFDAQRQRAGNR